MRCRSLTRVLFAAGVGACLLAGIVVPLRADDRHKCEEHVREVQAKFMKAVERYGATSRPANKGRAKVARAQKQCLLDELDRQKRNRERVRHQEHKSADRGPAQHWPE